MEMFAFLDMFSALEDVGVGAGSVSFAISVDDSNINNAIRVVFPKTSDADVTSVVVRWGGVCWVGVCVWGGSWSG